MGLKTLDEDNMKETLGRMKKVFNDSQVRKMYDGKIGFEDLSYEFSSD